MAVNIKTIIDAYLTRVNLSDANIAEDINNLQAAVEEIGYSQYQAAFANVETLAAGKTLTDDSGLLHVLNPNSADRTITLPAVAVTNHLFMICNASTGNYILSVVNSGATLIQAVRPSKTCIFFSDGLQWRVVGYDYIYETNYKITPTVATNNLTLTLTHMDGTTPSASRPLWFRIGDTMRAVTAALSVTVAAGANTFSAGSAFLATKTVGYFAYISWRSASSAVVLGFARVPFATIYSDFSGTATSELYAAFSTAPGSTDDVVNIGYFEATLGASATYYWSVAGFTSVNLRNIPTFESRWLISVSPNFTVATIDNGSGGQPPINEYRYRISGRAVDGHISGNGVKAGAGPLFSMSIDSLPFQPTNMTGYNAIGSAYLSDLRIPGVTVFFTGVHFVFSASIADNQAFTTGWGADMCYEV
jgi:hypothetical protein